MRKAVWFRTVDHDKAIYPANASGAPFTAAYIQLKGDPITNLYEDMAAEQKARSTYGYLKNMADDPDVIDPLKFLREGKLFISKDSENH